MLAFSLSCNTKETILPNVNSHLNISQAGSIEILAVNSFLESESQGNLKNHYETDFLSKIRLEPTDNTKGTILSSSSKNSEFQRLNFILDTEGNIETVFESFGFFDEMGNLVSYLHFGGNANQDIAYIDFTDGHREFLSEQRENLSTRTNSWWTRFDSCVGSFNGPTSSNVGNIVFDVIANSVTLGIYTPASIVLCGIAATASNGRVLATSNTPNIRNLRINWIL